MAPQISTPSVVRPDGLRRSKNHLMIQWRHRSLVRQVPGLYPLLTAIAIGMDACLLGMVTILLLPTSWQPDFIHQALLNTGEQSQSLLNYRWLPFACLASVLAAVNAATGTLATSRLARVCSLITSGILFIGSITLASIDLFNRTGQLGPTPLSSTNDWFVWIGCWSGILALGLEMISGRCWTLLAGSAVTALLFTLARHWPIDLESELASGVYSSRLGMLVPQLFQVGSHAAFALAWAFSLFCLVCQLVRPGKREPGFTLSAMTALAMRIGLCLSGTALILDSSWGGSEGSILWGLHSSRLWSLSPILVCLVILGCINTFHWNSQTQSLLVVTGFSLVALGWILCHSLSAPGLWLICSGILCLCVVMHTFLMERPSLFPMLGGVDS